MLRATSDLRDLAKSMVSLSGAASMFGIDQLGRLLDFRPTIPPADDSTRRIDLVTRAVTAQLEGRFSSAFARTNELQRGLVDRMFDLVTPNPSNFLVSGGAIVEPLVSALDGAFRGTQLEVRWLEMRNQLEIYLLVYDAAGRLGIRPEDRIPLATMVDRADSLGPFLALWAIEGLGHVYGQQALQDTPSPRALLTGPEAGTVRPGALPMLHAGIGLAFAQAQLAPVTRDNAATSLGPAIRDFVGLCRANSRPGLVGAAYESLGLMAQSFHPDLVAVIDRVLQRSADDLLGYFWHGVGRAIYFALRNLIPCAEIDWTGSPRAAPHEIGRLNITAGLAWAVNLVNMRQPAIMERLLERQGDVLSMNPAFAGGVGASTVIRRETTPDAPFLDAFLHHRPDRDAPDLVRLWEREVRSPSEQALSCVRRSLVPADQLGEFFRFPIPGPCSDPGGGATAPRRAD